MLKKRPMIIGTHHPDGVLVARGPNVRRGAVVPALPMVDVAPTVLYALGLDVPPDLEGAVPDGLFTAESIAHRPVRRGAPTVPPPHWAPPEHHDERASDTAGHEDDDEVMARLKALGYIE
jgi:hypothetical protein